MKTIQKGFTLIELMIVVAIIGILAAIAIPQYNNYVAQSQLSAALAEISGGKTQYENRLQRGDDGFDGNGSIPNSADPDEVGLQTNTSACSPITLNVYASTQTIPATGTGDGEINCTIDGNPQINGEHLALDRDGDGQWLCTASAGVPSDLLPPSCSQ